MTEERAKRKLSAILSADVKGYSRLMGEDELGTVRTLEAYREIIAEVIKNYRGRVVDSPGDNVLAEFASVVDAVESAVEIQQELKAKNAELPENSRMEFRIGINLGDVIEEGERIYGDGVNVAARIEGLAKGGGICISGTSFDQVEGKLGLEFEYLGERSVKNINKPVRVYRLKLESRVSDVEIGRELPLPDKPSIAVLPFVNMSGDPEQEFFSDGMAEEIITALSKIPKLFVIARNSSFVYKGKAVNVQQVSRELGVKYVLEGSVRKSGNRVRITAQLIDAMTGNHLWAERYDRELKDIFALQDEITMKILIAMQVKLTEGDQARLYGRGTDNLEAYLKLLQARQYVESLNRENIALAQQVLEEVMAVDPGYGEAYTWLAAAHFLEASFGFSKSPGKSMANAIGLAQKAITLDDSDANPHSILGLILTMKGEWEKGIAEGERAVWLNPNSADVHARLGVTLRHLGRWEEAILSFNQAIRLNPIPPVWYLFNMGLNYAMAARYEEAIALCDQAVHREPNNLLAWMCLAATYGLSGRPEEAQAATKEIFRINPNFSIIEQFRKRTPYKNQAHTEKLVNAMLKAGLK